MGEFEQAKPIIEKIKNEMDVNILVTFFSPSGYKNSLKYPYADLITYLPFDYSAQMERFISNVRPSLVILMRYDIWPNMIWQLKKVSVPVFIVDATMRSDSKRGIPLSRSFHKKIFCDITEILTVSDKDALNFTKFDIPVERVKSVGDTRFDRVYQKSLVAMNKKIFSKELFSGKKVIVLGSTWEADEEVMLPALLKLSEKAQDIRIVLVPHEPTIQRLEQLELQLKGKISIIRFSLLNNYKDEKVIIIDTIGILLTLYYYADMAYVGGSFRQGIHNVLEPAVYGIPVLFGPKIENSQEAQKMVNLGSGIVIRNKKEAFDKLDQLVTNTEEMSRLGQISKQYILDNIGATDKIMSEIKKYIS
jgi:3-deoxy-D-manno-octulosonic-acid transferase